MLKLFLLCFTLSYACLSPAMNEQGQKIERAPAKERPKKKTRKCQHCGIEFPTECKSQYNLFHYHENIGCEKLPRVPCNICKDGFGNNKTFAGQSSLNKHLNSQKHRRKEFESSNQALGDKNSTKRKSFSKDDRQLLSLEPKKKVKINNLPVRVFTDTEHFSSKKKSNNNQISTDDFFNNSDDDKEKNCIQNYHQECVVLFNYSNDNGIRETNCDLEEILDNLF